MRRTTANTNMAPRRAGGGATTGAASAQRKSSGGQTLLPGPDANDSDKSSSLTEEEDVGERVEQFPADPASQDEGPRLSSTDSDSDLSLIHI